MLERHAVKCKFVPNPKGGTKSGEAYRRYEGAKTVADFYGRAGDLPRSKMSAHLRYDLQHDYCKLDSAGLVAAWHEYKRAAAKPAAAARPAKAKAGAAPKKPAAARRSGRAAAAWRAAATGRAVAVRPRIWQRRGAVL